MKPSDILARKEEIKDSLNAMVEQGLLEYDSKQETYIDSEFSSSLSKKQRRCVSRAIRVAQKQFQKKMLHAIEQKIKNKKKLWSQPLKDPLDQQIARDYIDCLTDIEKELARYKEALE